ncbi:addiction module component, TIGR02574 family [Chlorobaculum parvum NCIB 8327]|uniref:Addiction module component, TIGR02574 family n=1 Tax=Chlorobaculum parvum (strain DSM 263 / NCIMB 8327) TaxID=517417 RepID=B3QQ04_CHLP8|nr:addiction module protein [Chlorobaculum parvum]ACF12007.1 addiction module component, TIGR02574 family [Chlorobaculum parvum NCIB 8327]
MRASAEKIMQDALDLTPVERAKMIERLCQGFNNPREAEIDTAWAAEFESRLDAYKEGKIKASPVEEVMERINRR